MTPPFDESLLTTTPRPDPRRTDAARYPLRYPMRFRFADLDPNGHVNNVALAALLEDARAMLLRALSAEAQGHGSWLLAQNVCHYLAEAFYPGEVEACAGIGRVGRSSFVVSTALVGAQGCLVVGDTVMVSRHGGTVGELPGVLRDSMQRWRLRTD